MYQYILDYVLPGILRVEDLYEDERHYYKIEPDKIRKLLQRSMTWIDYEHGFTRKPMPPADFNTKTAVRAKPPYHLSFAFCDDEMSYLLRIDEHYILVSDDYLQALIQQGELL